jgi:hypothetical protein
MEPYIWFLTFILRRHEMWIQWNMFTSYRCPLGLSVLNFNLRPCCRLLGTIAYTSMNKHSFWSWTAMGSKSGRQQNNWYQEFKTENYVNNFRVPRDPHEMVHTSSARWQHSSHFLGCSLNGFEHAPLTPPISHDLTSLCYGSVENKQYNFRRTQIVLSIRCKGYMFRIN